jgi:hypothetical protein
MTFSLSGLIAGNIWLLDHFSAAGSSTRAESPDWSHGEGLGGHTRQKSCLPLTHNHDLPGVVGSALTE